MSLDDFLSALNSIWVWAKPYVVSGGVLTVVSAIVAGLWKWLTGKKKNDAEVQQIEADTESTRVETVATLLAEAKISREELAKSNEKIFELRDAALAKDEKHVEELRNRDKEFQKRGEELIESLELLEECRAMQDRERTAVRRLFSRLNIPYWESDERGNAVHINQPWADMFGITFDTRSRWIEAVVEEDRERLSAEWESRYIDQDAATNIGFRMKTKTGEIVRVQSVYQILRRRDGEIVKIIGVTVKI